MDYDLKEEAKILRETVEAFPTSWFRQNEWRLLLQALGDLFVLGAGVWITLSYPTLWVCIPAWILMAGRVHALGVLTHDIGHFRHLERTPFKRVLFDAIICYPIVLNMDYYSYAHMLHHQWSNVPGKDPYFFPVNRQSVPSFLLFLVVSSVFLPVWLIFRLAVFPLTILIPPLRKVHAKYFGQFGAAPDLEDPHRLEECQKLWIWALGPTIFWYGAMIILVQTGNVTAFAWSYFIPLLFSVLVGQVRLACDHVYQEARDCSLVEQLAWSTNVEAPWWQSIIVAPHSMGYHGTHHVVPNVPNWHWKDAHERFKASGSKVYPSTVYPGYGAVIGKLLRDQMAWSSRDLREASDAASSVPEARYPSDFVEPGLWGQPVVSFDGEPVDRKPSPLLPVPSVADINKNSRDRAFTLSDLDWAPANRDLLFAPEEMTHLYYTDLYKELNPEERLTYNQAAAAGVSEQFVFLEQVLLVRGLKSFLHGAGKGIDPDLEEACHFFIDEEDKHSEMFRRMLLELDPATYEKETFDVYKLNAKDERFLSVSMQNPTFFIWWVWVATLFEEKTIDFHRKYQEMKAFLDPMHLKIHRFHCLDELRHLQMDHHFIDMLWEPAPMWKKVLNIHLFKKVMSAFVQPSRTVRAAVDRLVKKHPRLDGMKDSLIDAGMSVADSRSWHEATYSRTTLPNTFALFDRFPEMHQMSTVLPLYSPRPGEAAVREEPTLN